MPNTITMRHTCVWCEQYLDPEDTSMSKDESSGRVFYEHRYSCAGVVELADTVVSKATA